MAGLLSDRHGFDLLIGPKISVRTKKALIYKASMAMTREVFRVNDMATFVHF